VIWPSDDSGINENFLSLPEKNTETPKELEFMDISSYISAYVPLSKVEQRFPFEQQCWTIHYQKF